MAQAFNFETRQLVPFRDDWNRGGNVIISGALWYIKERDGIYLIDNEKTRPKPESRPFVEHRVAQGLPAALLAQGDALIASDFNFLACYKAYFKIAEKLSPNKPAYDIYTILEDWEMTLAQSFPCDYNLSGFIDNLSMMSVAVFIRDITNPYSTNSLVDKISQSYYFTTNFAGRRSPQIIYSKMPSIAARTEAPLIYACDIDQSLAQNEVLQADGFMAAVFNLALFYFWQRRWSEFNFTDTKVIEQVLNAYKRKDPIIDLVDLRKLSFNLPNEVEDICKAYMEVFMPVMQKVWKMKPTVQLECIEGDNIYTFIYAHEASSPERLYASELYSNLTNHQKRMLVSYGKRFMEWLVKTYPITMESQHRVMQAMSRDMPPIQVTIQNYTQVTHAGEKPQEEKSKKQKSVKTKKQELPKAKEETLCPYIDGDALKCNGIYTIDQFQKMLKQACEQEAKVLVAFLIKHKEHGNLDFHGASRKAIYIQLRQCFPTMRTYSYQNFAGAWKDALDSI